MANLPRYSNFSREANEMAIPTSGLRHGMSLGESCGTIIANINRYRYIATSETLRLSRSHDTRRPLPLGPVCDALIA